MNSISKKVREKLKITEGFIKMNFMEQADIVPLIKHLGETEWSKGKRMRIEACKKMMRIAESDENVAKAFMRGMDKASTQIAGNLMKRINDGYFSPQRKMKPDVSDSDYMPINDEISTKEN